MGQGFQARLHLVTASLVFPLQTDEHQSLSCAERALLSGQSLNINSQMAIVAGEMVHQLLNSQLKRMQVEVDLFRGSMKSTWISQENIDRIVERAISVIDANHSKSALG